MLVRYEEWWVETMNYRYGMGKPADKEYLSFVHVTPLRPGITGINSYSEV